MVSSTSAPNMFSPDEGPKGTRSQLDVLSWEFTMKYQYLPLSAQSHCTRVTKFPSAGITCKTTQLDPCPLSTREGRIFSHSQEKLESKISAPTWSLFKILEPLRIAWFEELIGYFLFLETLPNFAQLWSLGNSTKGTACQLLPFEHLLCGTQSKMKNCVYDTVAVSSTKPLNWEKMYIFSDHYITFNCGEERHEKSTVTTIQLIIML